MKVDLFVNRDTVTGDCLISGAITPDNTAISPVEAKLIGAKVRLMLLPENALVLYKPLSADSFDPGYIIAIYKDCYVFESDTPNPNPSEDYTRYIIPISQAVLSILDLNPPCKERILKESESWRN